MLTIKVDKIRSYQTLVYKNGIHSFPKKEYKDYEQEIRLQLMMLPRIKELVDTSLKIHFKCKNKVVGDLDNITKVFTTEESIEKYGKLVIMNKNEYEQYKKKIKNKAKE